MKTKAFGIFLMLLSLGALSAKADFVKTNPVTGESENYTWKFVGTDTWNGTSNWQDSTDANPSGTPAKTGENTWDPILFDGNTININASMSVEGWNLRMGLYNGANVTMNTFVKYQGDTTMWMTVDDSSQLTIGGFGGGNLTDGQIIKLSSAKANGIAWNVGLTSGNANNTFEYYLAGNGSVSYQAVSAANHKIKQADITLSGTKEVKSKTLVSFTSTDKTFTADATIRRLNSSGVDLDKDIALATVNTTGTTTLTTGDAVGTCELVQTSTGIVLYWVDGDPDAIVVKTYKPSISINFTSGTALSTAADVGIGDYALPGTSWNNLIGNNGSLTTMTGVDATGAASTIDGAKVTISGTRGYWTKSGLAATSDLRQAYIDDADGNATPTVVVEGIPYYKYMLVLYFSNDTDGRSFGHLTINGTNYRWDSENSEIVTCDGTSSDVWGSSSSTAYTEGGNYLVFPAMANTDGTLTVIGHRWSGTQRAGVAAMQIIEVKPDVDENDLIINVDGDTVYTVDKGKSLSGTVYITGSGTLTLSGSEKITATTIEVSHDVLLYIDSDRLDATTFVGGGTVVYDNTLPVAGKGWTESDWTGVVWIKNYTLAGLNPGDFANANSTLRLSLCTGYFNSGDNTQTCEGTLDLQNDTGSYAFSVSNGWSNNGKTIFAKLTGSGTLGVQSKDIAQRYIFKDASEFTGAINIAGRTLRVIIGDGEELAPANGSITIVSGADATIASGKTWTANQHGFIVDGTLTVDGTLASSAGTSAVSGSGTVVFNEKLPSPTGDAWWKNSDWRGTVQIKSVAFTGSNDANKYLDVNKYGNADSTLELYNCSGWLPYGRVEGDNTCAVPLKITGTLTINDGISNKQFTINKLSGSGAIYTTSNSATVTIQVLNADDFTGCVNLNSKRVIFGETIPDTFTSGQIVIGGGFSFTVPNSDAAWYGTGGITLDGELKATSLSNFGGGTIITTGDTGIFTFIDSNNTQDHAVDYARITGTGTLRYADVEGKWRSLSTVNFPTGMICENNLSAGLILQTAGGEHIIGSLAGSGVMRSDWGSGNRSLKILQAKDTEYSGLFHTDDRISAVTVAPGESSAGTLTLSGTQTVSNDLVVESGVGVNLTGTWVGATTVSGTIGGTGTLTGALTFNAGSTFKAFSQDEDGLTVSGAITMPSEGKVVVDASALDDDALKAGVVVISGSGLDANKFELSPASDDYKLVVVQNKLMIRPKVVVDSYVKVSELETAFTEQGLGAPLLIVSDGVKITFDTNFTSSVVVESEGSVTLVADEQPDLSSVSFDVKGSLIRSWLMPGVVGFNFYSDAGNVSSDALVTGTWYGNASNKDGASTEMFADGLSALTWSSSTCYSYSGTSILNGYLDDGANGGNGAVVTLSNVPYEAYDVIIYCSSDSSSGTFLAKTVNGTQYTWDAATGAAVAGNAAWGKPALSTPVYGVNAMRIKNLSGQLTIYGGVKSGSQRGGIAAIQIMPAGTPDNVKIYKLSLNGSATNWSSGTWTLNDAPIDEAPTSGSVEIVASASTELTIDDTVSLAELTVTSAPNVVVTVKNGSGGSLSAIKATIESGVFKQGNAAALGAAANIVVKDGATFDLNGLAVNEANIFQLEGAGAGDWPWALTSSGGESPLGTLRSIALIGDATVGGSKRIQFGNATNACSLDLGGHTLTKVGAGELVLANVRCKSGATGTIDIQAGIFSVNNWCNLDGSKNDGQYANTTVILCDGTELKNNTDRAIIIDALKWHGGSITGNQPFAIASAFEGSGTVSKLWFVKNPTVTLTGDLTVTTLSLETISGYTTAASPSFVKGDGVEGVVTLTAGNAVTVGAGGGISVGADVKLDVEAGGLINNGSLYWEGEISGLITNNGSVVLAADNLNILNLRDFSKVSVADGITITALEANQTQSEYLNGLVRLTDVPSSVESILINKLSGDAAQAVQDTESNTWKLDGDIQLDGIAALYDFTFTHGKYTTEITNAGSRGGTLNLDGATIGTALDAESGNLFVRTHPYVGTGNYPTEFTVAVYGTMPQNEHNTLIAFGNKTDGCLALVKGATENDVNLIWAKGDGTGENFQNISSMRAKASTEEKHLYVFEKTANSVSVYLDGLEKITVTSDEANPWPLGNNGGFQVGSVLQGIIEGVATRPASDDPATIEAIRIYGEKISADVMAALKAAFPFADEASTSERTLDAEDGRNSWYGEEIGTWTNTPADVGDAGLLPRTNANVTLTVAGEVPQRIDVVLNGNTVDEPNIIGDLHITGSQALTIRKSIGGHPVSVSGILTNDVALTVHYGAIDLAYTALHMGEDATLTFELSELINDKRDSDRVYLTGVCYNFGTERVTYSYDTTADTFVKLKEFGWDSGRQRYYVDFTAPRAARDVWFDPIPGEGVTNVLSMAMEVYYEEASATKTSPILTGDRLHFKSGSEAVVLVPAGKMTLDSYDIPAGVTVIFEESFTNRVSGAGTIVMASGLHPKVTDSAAISSLKASAWQGKLVMENVDFAQTKLDNFGNANSAICLKGCSINNTTADSYTVASTLELANGSDDSREFGLDVIGLNSSGGKTITFSRFTGDGALMNTNTALEVVNYLRIQNASEFTGAISNLVGTAGGTTIILGEGDAAEGSVVITESSIFKLCSPVYASTNLVVNGVFQVADPGVVVTAESVSFGTDTITGVISITDPEAYPFFNVEKQITGKIGFSLNNFPDGVSPASIQMMRVNNAAYLPDKSDITLIPGKAADYSLVKDADGRGWSLARQGFYIRIR